MTPLSKSAEKKLIQAIEKAAALVNDGLSPNDAIIKSASEAQVPAGHVNLMVHAYNTGRTTKQREQGDTTLEKAADFSLADADAVLAALYPETVKTSAELKQATVVSTDYAVSPKHAIARREAALKKAAALARPLPENTYTPPPRDPKAAVLRQQSEKMAAARAAEETRRQAFEAYQKAATQFDALAEYFRRPGNIPFQAARREVTLRFGDLGTSVLDKVAEVYPRFAKQADDNKNHFGNDPVYGLVENVVRTLENYNSLQARVVIKEAAQPEKKIKPADVTGSVLDALEEKPLELKQAGLSWALAPTKFVGKRMGESPGPSAFSAEGLLSGAGIMDAPASGAAKPRDTFRQLTSPDHEFEMKNIRSRGVLHDLMLNDDVIAGYDPREVATAFNDISSISPDLIDSPGAMQAILRKRLEAGQMADFDVKQLMEMEKLRAERDKLTLESRKLEEGLI
jgi:hypothetical protein